MAGERERHGRAIWCVTSALGAQAECRLRRKTARKTFQPDCDGKCRDEREAGGASLLTNWSSLHHAAVPAAASCRRRRRPSFTLSAQSLVPDPRSRTSSCPQTFERICSLALSTTCHPFVAIRGNGMAIGTWAGHAAYSFTSICDGEEQNWGTIATLARDGFGTKSDTTFNQEIGN